MKARTAHVERRTKEALNTLVFFSLILLFVFQFALGPDRERLVSLLPGLLWLNHLIVTDWVAPGGTKPVSELIAGSSDFNKTLVGGLYPFIVGDLMKLLAAAMLLPGAWAIVEKFRSGRGPK